MGVSSESNNLVVFHVEGGDLVGCLRNTRNEDRIGELVGTVKAHLEQ